MKHNAAGACLAPAFAGVNSGRGTFYDAAKDTEGGTHK